MPHTQLASSTASWTTPMLFICCSGHESRGIFLLLLQIVFYTVTLCSKIQMLTYLEETCGKISLFSNLLLGSANGRRQQDNGGPEVWLGNPPFTDFPWSCSNSALQQVLSQQLPSPGSLSDSEDSCSIEIFVLFYPCNSSRFYLDFLKDL